MINKKLKIKAIAYFIVYTTIAITINSITYPTIGVNDDEFFSQLVSGDYTGKRKSFTHISPASPQWFFGFIVTKFYLFVPEISWYFIILLFTVLISLVYLTVTFNSENNVISFSELMMVILSVMFLTWYVPSPTYTSTAFISGLAGIFGLVNMIYHKHQGKQIYIPSLFFCWSLSIRSESFYATIIIFLPVVILSLFKSKDLKYVFKVIIKTCLIPIVIFASNLTADQIVFSKTEWQIYKDFNTSRYIIQDNEIERVLSGNPNSFGWSQAEYRLFDSYNFIYFDIYSGAELKTIITKFNDRVGTVTTYNFDDISTRWSSSFKPYYSLIYSSSLIFVYTILIQLFSTGKKRKVIEFIGLILGLSMYICVIIVFLTVNLRLPERVVFPISFFIPSMVVLIGNTYTYNLVMKMKYLNKSIYSFLSILLLILTIHPSFKHTYNLKRNPAYTSFWSEQKKLLLGLDRESVFVGNASQFKSVWSNPYTSDQESELIKIHPLGWYTFSPYWHERGKLLGINSQSIGNELGNNPKIIWISDKTILGDVLEIISKQEGINLIQKEIATQNFDFGDYNLYQLSRIPN